MRNVLPFLQNYTHKIVHSSAMHYQNLNVIHKPNKKLLTMKSVKSFFFYHLVRHKPIDCKILRGNPQNLVFANFSKILVSNKQFRRLFEFIKNNVRTKIIFTFYQNTLALTSLGFSLNYVHISCCTINDCLSFQFQYWSSTTQCT